MAGGVVELVAGTLVASTVALGGAPPPHNINATALTSKAPPIAKIPSERLDFGAGGAIIEAPIAVGLDSERLASRSIIAAAT